MSFSTISEKSNNTMISENNKDKMNFVFKTTSQLNKEISISEEKSLKDLRKKYFNEIDISKLRNDKTILFLMSGKVIPNKSKICIKDYFKKKEGAHIITVVDVENDIFEEAKKNNFEKFDK